MLAALMANIPEGITICDSAGNILMVSWHGQDLLGAPQAGKNIDEVAMERTIYRPDGRTILPMEEIPLARALKGEVVKDMELVQVGLSGQKIPLLCNAAPVRNATGAIVGGVVAWRDISDHKRAEESLRASEERFRSVMENMSEGLILFDEQGVIYRNPASLRIFDFKAGQYIEYRDLSIQWKSWDEDGRPLPFEEWPLSRVLRHECFQNQVLHLVGVETGRELWASYNGFSILGTDGKLTLGFITIRDITENKAAEKALKASLAEKEVLLKEIHHRVKNNMQVISSLVSLEADESKDAVVRDVLRDVTHRVRSMALVHERLYQSADLARIDFAEYTESLLGYLWRSYGGDASNIHFTTDLEKVSLPVSEAVPCGLILNELISNALKHAFPDNREGQVHVSLQNNQEGQVVLYVRDNGVGLPGDYDWKKAPSLGLRLVRMLAGQINADVEVTSSAGTEFKTIIRSLNI